MLQCPHCDWKTTSNLVARLNDHIDEQHAADDRRSGDQRRIIDHVNPPHYQGDYVMRIIEDFRLDFLDGQVAKYILRRGHKVGEPALRDYEKALWYLQRKIANLKKAPAALAPASPENSSTDQTHDN